MELLKNKMKNKTALITGSSRGIGAASALLFAEAGAKVAVHGRDGAAIEGVKNAIARTGGCAEGFQADVTQFEAMRHAIEGRLGPIDILVANAGGKRFSAARADRGHR